MSIIDAHDSNILIIIKFYCEKVMFILTRSMKIIKRIEKIIIFFSHVFNSNYIIFLCIYYKEKKYNLKVKPFLGVSWIIAVILKNIWKMLLYFCLQTFLKYKCIIHIINPYRSFSIFVIYFRTFEMYFS